MAITTSKKVFICHSVFFAFIDRAHPKNTIADAYFRHFAEHSYHLYSDQANIITCYTNIRKHISNTIAKEFLRALTWGSVDIIRSNEVEEKDALKLLNNNPDAQFTYQNALISVLAYRHGISQVVTFDPHQASFGQVIFSLPF